MGSVMLALVTQPGKISTILPFGVADVREFEHSQLSRSLALSAFVPGFRSQQKPRHESGGAFCFSRSARGLGQHRQTLPRWPPASPSA